MKLYKPSRTTGTRSAKVTSLRGVHVSSPKIPKVKLNTIRAKAVKPTKATKVHL